MQNFNLNLTLHSDAPIEDLCDQIREVGKDDVRATWDENEDGTFNVWVRGQFDHNEFTFGDRGDLINDAVNSLNSHRVDM